MNRSLPEPALVFDFTDAAGRPEQLAFADPVEVISTTLIAEVQSCLRAIEERVGQGFYAAGYVSYEAAPAMDPALQVRPDTAMPLVWFGVFRSPGDRSDETLAAFTHSNWQSSIDRSEYDHGIAAVRDAISRGDTYQVNHSFRLRAQFAGDDYSFYRVLQSAQPAPYSAYLNLGRYRVLSVSPELFFRRNGSTITTRPMKGTTRRGRWLEEDTELAQLLRQSEKNRAENVMIVDLLRNDLGRIAKTGSVEVRKLFVLERYRTLWQMTSTIDAELRDGTSLGEIFSALFPSGSVTGAPKVSTMKLITRLEDSPRNVYCGAIGFVRPGGDAVFNVAIRTMVIDHEQGTAEYGVGGGVTWDSTALAEYHEALDKAAVLLDPAIEFELLETLLLKNGSFVLLERHLARLESSARYFGYAISVPQAREALMEIAVRAGNASLRVRLMLSSNGLLRTESHALEESGIGVMPVNLASRPISRNNPLLFHKTTHRQTFDQLKGEFPEAYDVLLWNEEHEVTEFTTGNLIVELDGNLVTPPRECGLLAGTLRAELLANGEVVEAVLSVADLQRATRLWLINSVRGWVEVDLPAFKTTVASHQ
jgi:para-aminobenzoate synthetase/4-amino-4-deoxychorismate lyase